MTPAARRTAFDRTTLAFAAILLIATGLRVWALTLIPLNLYTEEAQLWAMSRTLAWGYALKPPLAIWAIWATTHAFGDAEWAVRLAAPISQSLAALGLYALARSAYGAWAGFWSGVTWLVVPGIWLSSVVVSTGVLMLPLWVLAVFSLWRLAQTRAWFWTIALGAAAGLGLLADYAMLYFPLCAALAASLSQPVREALKNGRGVAASVVALAIFAPHLAWNAEHDFATFSRAVTDVRLDPSALFNLDNLIDFASGQALLVGPILFVVLIGLLWRRGASVEDRFLLSFTLPPLALVTLATFISHVSANWAATAYPAAIAWTVGNLFINAPGKRVLVAALVLNLVIGVITIAAVLHPSAANGFRGIRTANAWDETAREIALRTAPQRGDRPFSAVVVDDRAAYYELNYYWRQARAVGAPLPPLRMWTPMQSAHTAAEIVEPLRPNDGGHVLVVHAQPRYIPFVAGDFTNFRTVEHLTIPLGGGANREFDISVGEGFAPAARDAAFLQRLRSQSQP